MFRALLKKNIVLCLYHCSYCSYSSACAIPDTATDTVVVTGGTQPRTSVVRYGQQGWLEDLPGLLTGRYLHACSSFVSSGRLVSKYQRELLSGTKMFRCSW